MPISAPTAPRDVARLASAVPRYYAYNFFISLQLWISIWVVYLQEERGLSLTQARLVGQRLLDMVEKGLS